MLDTNICIYATKPRKYPQLIEAITTKQPSQIFLSSIVLAELYFGAYKSAYVQRNLEAVALFIRDFTVRSFDAKAAQRYGELRAVLAAKGQSIGPYDTQIAAHALAEDAVLVSHNVKEFCRVPHLVVEDWLAR